MPDRQRLPFGSNGACPRGDADPRDSTPDSVSFAAVIRVMARGPGQPIMVDPRPLKADPRIVSLLELPDVSPTDLPVIGSETSLLASRNEAVAIRSRVLSTLSVAEADVSRHRRCPGVLVPLDSAELQRKRELCPAEQSLIVVVALPRDGGPGLSAVAAPDSGRSRLVSVRVIARSVGPKGAAESASDYVFERSVDGTLRFREKVELFHAH
jgi:hypothetical protein